MLELLEVTCEACGEGLEVPAAELFEFDCRCPSCGGLLVLHLSRPPAEVVTDFHDRPTKADSIDAFPGPQPSLASLLEGHRPAPPPTQAAAEAPAPPPLAPAPAAAPAPAPALPLPPSPAAPAAAEEIQQIIDSSPLAAPTTSFRLAKPPPVPVDLDDEDEDAPPDPYEEAARALDRAMTDSVRKTRRARRLSSMSSESSASVDSDVGSVNGGSDLDGLVEVVQVPAGGTGGRGSRTYEREELMPDGGGTAIKSSGHAPTGTIDLDWLALIEDAPLDEDTDTSVSRVIIKLPQSATPTENGDADKARQFQEAVQKLEQDGASSLANRLSPEEQERADEDTRSWSSEGPDPETKPWKRDDDGEVTRPGWRTKKEGRDETTKPWKKEQLEAEAADDKTADWEGEPDEKTAEWVRSASPDPETKSWPDAQDSAVALEGLTQAADTGEAPTAKHFRADASRGRLESTQSLEVNTRPLTSKRQAGAYQQLFNKLFVGKNGDAPSVLMVTSPRPKDGKTTVAANLALVVARQHDAGAVLIDADPLGGGLLRALGIKSRKEGLLEALQGEAEPREYARRLKVGCPLDLVPLGIPSSDAEDLLASGRMRDFLKCVRRDFPKAVVVLDTASANNSSPQALAQEVDGVLLVVRAGTTPRDEVARSVNAIGRDKILGVVLNDAREGC